MTLSQEFSQISVKQTKEALIGKQAVTAFVEHFSQGNHFDITEENVKNIKEELMVHDSMQGFLPDLKNNRERNKRHFPY